MLIGSCIFLMNPRLQCTICEAPGIKIPCCTAFGPTPHLSVSAPGWYLSVCAPRLLHISVDSPNRIVSSSYVQDSWFFVRSRQLDRRSDRPAPIISCELSPRWFPFACDAFARGISPPSVVFRGIAGVSLRACRNMSKTLIVDRAPNLLNCAWRPFPAVRFLNGAIWTRDPS